MPYTHLRQNMSSVLFVNFFLNILVSLEVVHANNRCFNKNYLRDKKSSQFFLRSDCRYVLRLLSCFLCCNKIVSPQQGFSAQSWNKATMVQRDYESSSLTSSGATYIVQQFAFLIIVSNGKGSIVMAVTQEVLLNTLETRSISRT